MKQLSIQQTNSISGGERRVYFNEDGSLTHNQMPYIVSSSDPFDYIDSVMDQALLDYARSNNIPVNVVY